MFVTSNAFNDFVLSFTNKFAVGFLKIVDPRASHPKPDLRSLLSGIGSGLGVS